MCCTWETRKRNSPGAFTLLEILLAIALMAVVCTVTYMTFSVCVMAWKKGQAMSDSLHHGDFTIEQLSMALRSAYFPSAKPGGDATYGFSMEDNGDGPYSSDTISWAKLGTSLVGSDCPFAGSPHRVQFFVGTDEESEQVARIRAWPLFGQDEDFDPEQDVEPMTLSRGITGFNCRPAFEMKNDEIDWLDEWEETNRLPRLVEITLYLKPLEEGGEPLEIKRVVTLPVAPLAWK